MSSNKKNGQAQRVQSPEARTVKAIAFYLPQYHPVPENDLWWGKGFTEWNNVTRAKPLFQQHDQPRRPADLGYYDLRNPETQEAQAELAAAHGVFGFCYYYYWFGGRRLLNRPIEQMLASGRPNFPFCVCWANEHWSRNWDGQNRHVLLSQEYSTESNRAFIREIIPMMEDPRYIRHNGKPVLVVYRISTIPNWRQVAHMWRRECRKAGIGEIHLCAVRFGLEPLQGQPDEHGLDAYVMFPPHEAAREDLRATVAGLHPEFGGEIFSYEAVVQGDLERFAAGYPWPVHRGAMMGWDNTARRMFAARIFQGATPVRLRAWLREMLRQEDQYNPSDESLIFINAWNEWAEGTVLEPDERFGRGYLAAVQSAVSGYVVPRHASSHVQAAAPRLATSQSRLQRLRTARAFDRNGQPEWFNGHAEHREGAHTILLTAHISGHQLYGGERSLLDVLRALSLLGYNVIVTLPSGNNRSYMDEIRASSLGLYVLPYPQWREDREPIERLNLCFETILLRHQVSAVHANTIVQLEALVAARRLGLKVVVHARELITLDTGLCDQIGLPAEDIIARVLARSDFIIANSMVTAQVYAKPGKTFTVYNTISLEDFEIAPELGTPLRFGIVSSNIEKKGVGDFIELVRRVGRDMPSVEFVVVGPERPETLAWQAEVETGTLPDNLRFTGYRETPAEAMSELDVLLNLSQFAESFGRTVAEAAAAGKPSIAYYWGALPEVVEDGQTGLLVGYRDIDALGAAVRALSEDPDRVSKMGHAARERVKARFSPQALTEALARAYEVILKHVPISGLPVLHDDPTIIIPVYNAFEAFADCLSALKRNTAADRLKVIVVDDASPDPRIGELLSGLESDDRFTVLRNVHNLGYTRSINLAIKAAGRADIVLLNSDAAVTPNWLDGLQVALASGDRVGTVTAMSDNAGAFSFPEQGRANPLPGGVERDEFARLMIQATGSAKPVEVPTGSGFCMYIRRALLDEIGLFDEEAFPRGYGEENDFCMRAMDAGWINLISPWAYVFHVRTASFGSEKEALIESGVAEVIRRYPDYVKRVRAAFGSTAMEHLRAAARAVYN